MSKKILNSEQEYRYVPAPELVTEERAGTPVTVVRGTAVFFNQLSHDLGGFREMFAPGAFDDVLDGDTVALLNHDINSLLGRTVSGTCRLMQDETGLHYEFDVPNTSTGKDTEVLMKRGDISQSSFSFSIQKDKWERDADNNEIRTVEKVKRLYDVSPVVFPAYPQTISQVAQRSYESWKEELSQPEKQQRRAEEDRQNYHNIILDADIELMGLKSQM
jgi:uncharacterized protein